MSLHACAILFPLKDNVCKTLEWSWKYLKYAEAAKAFYQTNELMQITSNFNIMPCFTINPVKQRLLSESKFEYL